MKVALVTLQGVIGSYGGTARVFFNMANNLVARGFSVTAIASDPRPGTPAFNVDEKVTFVNCVSSCFSRHVLEPSTKFISAFAFNRQRRRTLRQVLDLQIKAKAIKKAITDAKADVIISYQQETTYMLIEILKIQTPIITMVHRDPDEYFSKPEFPLYKNALNNCAFVQVLLPQFIEVASKYINKEQLVYIPNVVPQFSQSSNLENPLILNVSRIGEGKRQHLLIEAFAQIKDRYPDWKVECWGWAHSVYAKKLQNLIAKEGLQEQVTLCGETSKVAQKLESASIFVFPSEIEGFSLALTEAMSMGLACIGCEDCPAVRTLIENNVNGLLAQNNANDIADKIELLIKDKELRQKLGTNAKVSMHAFSEEKVWDMWEQLIYKAAN